MFPYSDIYKKLLQLIPYLPEHISNGNESGCSALDTPGMMDLHFDYIGKDKHGNPIISLTHYFEQNGDLVPDPDMEIRIVLSERMAEAMTFQNQYIYQEIYTEHQGETYVHLKNKRDLNEFLYQWLTNAIEQGHRIELGEKKKERTEKLEQLGEENEDREKDCGMER